MKTVTQSFLFTFCFVIFHSTSFAQKIQQSKFSIGDVLSFESKVLGEARALNIYLPVGYEAAKEKKYPVIYLFDGSKDEDFIHIAGLVQFASFEWINTMPESIVVGIANVDRKRDFTYPTTNKKDKADFPTTGGSEQFISFIEKELQPMISGRYRTNSNRTIIGQSLGGLLATEILIKKPELFDNYVIVSPSMWWDDGSLYEKITDNIGENKSIFIGVGKEGPVMVPDAMRLYTTIMAKKSKSSKVYYNYYEQLDHGDTLHLAVYDAFGKLFKKQETTEGK